MKYLILLLTSAFAFNSHAEVDTTDLATADETIEAPSLNIEGQVHEKEAVVPKEEKKLVVKKVKRQLSTREKLEIRNQNMVLKKMEQIRMQQELALARKLEQSMNETIKAIDTK